MAPEKSQTSQQSETELPQYQEYISNIRKAVFTVGFNRSGSSLIGDLLSAHPNIVMDNESGIIRRYMKGEFTSRESLLSFIIKYDMNRGKKKNYVAGQYQQHYDCNIEVVGDKHSPHNTVFLTKSESNTLEELEKFIQLPIKLLFNVRNPYDMVASMVNSIPNWRQSQNEKIKKAISFFTHRSADNMKLIDQVPTNRIFMIRLEDFIATPKSMLSDICDFLGVAKTPEYLSSCTEVTYKMPNKSRDTLNWNEEYGREIDALIKKYEFFSGYSRDT